MTEAVALKVYKSMILPYFDYEDVKYNTANLDCLDKIQRLQNRCLKIYKEFNVRSGTNELHAVTHMPMGKERRVAHVNNFMLHRLKRQHLVDTREIRTRAHDAPLFTIKISKVEAYKRSIEYAGATQWNSLPVATHSIKDP